MKVVIVGKTRMETGTCIGALSIEGGESLRLHPPGRDNYPRDPSFELGQVWEIDFQRRPDCKPPHTEDVTVTYQDYITKRSNMKAVLHQLARLGRAPFWSGRLGTAFGTCLEYTNRGRAHIGPRAVPSMSTGFWTPDKPLRQISIDNRTYYEYPGQHAACHIPYIGFEREIGVIPNDALIRLSLARWWRNSPDIEERCYLQISGWWL